VTSHESWRVSDSCLIWQRKATRSIERKSTAPEFAVAGLMKLLGVNPDEALRTLELATLASPVLSRIETTSKLWSVSARMRRGIRHPGW
jgi:hypothetical protein